jgi:hypothetical protein
MVLKRLNTAMSMHDKCWFYADYILGKLKDEHFWRDKKPQKDLRGVEGCNLGSD